MAENQVAIINKSIVEIKKMPEILLKNQGRSEKGVMIGNKLISQWDKAFDIEDEEERLQALRDIDGKSNTYLVNVSAAVKEMEGERKPFTQLMTNMAKYFTEAEASIKKENKDSIPFQIQFWRNKLAELEAKRENERKRKAEEKAAKEQAKIDLKTGILTSISNSLNEYLANKKMSVTNKFNAITLETYSKMSEALKKMVTAFPKEDQGGIIQKDWDVPALLAEEDLEQAISECTFEFDFDGFYESYKADMDQLKQHLVDRLPSKKTELDEAKKAADQAEKERLEIIESNRLAEIERQKAIDAANGKKKKELEEAARLQKIEEEKLLAEAKKKAELEEQERKQKIQEREDNEKLRLKDEAEQKATESQEKIQVSAAGATALMMFDAMAETQVESAAQVKTGVTIELQHSAGWMLIAQLWWEQLGKTLTNDEISKKTFAQMKSFAEDLALKKDIKIDSKLIVYKPVYKAVNSRK